MDNPIISFFIDLLSLVLTELFALFAIFFLLGYILHILQKRTNVHYQQGLGWRGIYLTAWIGTPIHEFGHLLFIKLFRHKVTTISLFQPDKETGTLGHVDHSYNKRSLYQQVGLFFIGAAPLLFGSLFLLLLTYLFVPNGHAIFASLMQPTATLSDAIHHLWDAATQLFSLENLRQPFFWLYLYISFSIASHMAPSAQDRKNMYKGLLWIIIILAILNVIPLLLGISLVHATTAVAGWLSLTFGAFFLAIILSTTHLLLSYLLLYLPARALRR